MPTKAEILEDYHHLNREHYNLLRKYSELSVIKNRAIFSLRVIAGLVPELKQSNPGKYAFDWLKEHDLIAEQGNLDFNQKEIIS